MKTFYSAITIITIVLLSPILFAQNILTGRDAKKIIGNTELIRTNKFSEIPSYIKYEKGNQPSTIPYLNSLSKNLKIQPDLNLVLISETQDELGFTHYRYQQYHNNTPIEFTMWIVHSKNGKIVSQNGFIHKSIQVSKVPGISIQTSITKAIQFVNAKSYRWENAQEEAYIKVEQNNDKATFKPTPSLTLLPKGTDYSSDNYLLAYKMNIYASEPLSLQTIYVDANSGEIINSIEKIHHADANGTAHTGYSGIRNLTTDSVSANLFRLRESGRGLGIETFDMKKGTDYNNAVDFTDTDNTWNNANSQFDEYATDAHWGAEMTYDYFFSQHNRNSIDDQGFKLISYVHFDNAYNNAFWDGSRMTYGDGNGNPLTSLDIAGHEISHGLTEFSANLIYQAESGALNESFSDIFGTAIEKFSRPTNWNWELGEDLGTAFRSLSNPKSKGDPDTYFGTNWASLTGADQGGVHTNSSVQNYWFYLLSQGGTGTNDNGDSYNVNGIGVEDAAKVAYRNLTVYLTRTSKFADARFYAIVSAADLFGDCTSKVGSVTDAWYAVGVGSSYVPYVLADFNVESTLSCAAPFDVQFENNSSNGRTFLWNFGDGTTSTDINPFHTYTAQGNYNVSLTATGGTCGIHDTIKTSYIQISDTLPCSINLPAFGNAVTQTKCSGKLYDNGGPNGDYKSSFNSSITIEPTGASSVILNFLSFDVEAGQNGSCNYDKLTIFDGSSTSSTVIGEYCNNNIPTSVTSSGGAITIRFTSDGGVEGAGFALEWICNQPNTPPTPNFMVQSNACDGSAEFTDNSNNSPTSWEWNFGDGATSTSQNPSHIYMKNGRYDVTLKSINAFGSKSITKMEVVKINFASTPTFNVAPICNWQKDTLIATSPGNSKWYQNLFDNTSIHDGDTLITPPIGSTRTYYLQQSNSSIQNNVGPVDNSFGTGGNYTGDQSLIFNVDEALTIETVEVYANGAGPRTIELHDNLGAVLASKNVTLTDGLNVVSLNFNVPPGTDFELTTAAGSQSNLYRNNTGANYPYSVNNLIQITSSTAGPDFYYFFYNWKVVSLSCLSERVNVEAVVNICTGINEANSGIDFSIYPNPAQDEFTVSFKGKASNTSIQVMNAIGQEILSVKTLQNQEVINASSWTKGVYVVKITQGEEVDFERVVIQ